MLPPKVIFFDAVGTLFGVRGTVGEIYAQFAQRIGLSVSAEQLNQAFTQNFRVAPRAAFSEALPQELARLEYCWWRDVAYRSFEAVGVVTELPDFDAFFTPLFAYFETAAPWVIYPETVQVLETLQASGMELGVISNFDSRLQGVLRALNLEQWFGSVTISTQVGSAKPEADIFAAALAKHPYPSAEAWHVGDSWTEDYQGSVAAGLQGIWLNRAGGSQAVRASTATAVPEIADLTMLHSILHSQS